MSVSGEVPLTSSLDLMADQKLWKSWSLLWGGISLLRGLRGMTRRGNVHEMPDLAEVRGDEGALENGGGCWDRRHFLCGLT